MQEKSVIQTEQAPKPIGPYSIGIQCGDFIFTAGQAGVDPQTGKLVPGGIAAETNRVFLNLQAILEAAGSSLSGIVKTTVFLRDMNDFGAMNTVYTGFFKTNFPARTTVQAAALPLGAAVEIEAIAIAGGE